MDNPILSVIVPVYQVEDYLERCLESILIQDFQNYEIVLVDDGSTDRSPEICDNYAAKYEHIRVIHKENGGLSDARNVGLDAAKGAYVIFIDSDDWLASSCFKELAHPLEKKEQDIITFKRTFVKSEKELTASTPLILREMTGYEAFVDMLEKRDVTGFATDKIYKKSLFKDNKIQFPVGHYYEDLATLYKLFLNTDNVLVSNQSYYYYFVDNADAITASWNELKFNDILQYLGEVHHSDLTLTNLKSEDQNTANLYYVEGLIHILASLYKAGFDQKLPEYTAYVLSELERYPVRVSDLSARNEQIKYLLYRLSLLKAFFKVSNRLTKK